MHKNPYKRTPAQQNRRARAAVLHRECVHDAPAQFFTRNLPRYTLPLALTSPRSAIAGRQLRRHSICRFASLVSPLLERKESFRFAVVTECSSQLSFAHVRFATGEVRDRIIFTIWSNERGERLHNALALVYLILCHMRPFHQRKPIWERGAVAVNQSQICAARIACEHHRPQILEPQTVQRMCKEGYGDRLGLKLELIGDSPSHAPDIGVIKRS